ncbi:hypothetical protein [Chryseolinea lacunae]|uniref:Uncharacterized protein n=1 Tax=Chryseolinea lacunae TaxID=2801331 RepID=A0ABS1KVK9_9BACT|nr:hypothetical protein [Chryseolinea lacunae]MBL0743486.1 hypothetical protein [Chryseolinea lacunae]
MQSRQLNFFIHPDDLPEIEVFLREENALFIKQPTFEIANLYSDSIAFDDRHKFDTVFLVKADQANHVVTQWIAPQGYWLVDAQSSCAIQFSRGGLTKDGKKLNRARFYYTSFYYHEGERIEKPKEFVAWADRLKRKFRKRFMVPGAGVNGNYYSPRVEKILHQQQTGVHLSGWHIDIS